MTSAHQEFIQTEPLQTTEADDPRVETLDRQGWTADDIRRKTAGVVTGRPQADDTLPARQTFRSPAGRSGSVRSFVSDPGNDPYWNGTVQPSAEEQARAAGPDSPGWIAAHAVAAEISARSLKRRAEEQGSDHYLSALERARRERKARP